MYGTEYRDVTLVREDGGWMMEDSRWMDVQDGV